MPNKKKNSINIGVPGGKTSGQCPGAPKKKSVKVINKGVTWANMFQKVMIPHRFNSSPKTYAQEQEQKKQKKSKTPAKKSKK
tara:strand:- start:525 stop:770 length:246 start_codon:yes stop_codon:yes gene_type:complete